MKTSLPSRNCLTSSESETLPRHLVASVTKGTGVKIRDWEPLDGQQGQQQVIALRAEPGKVYDTYFSYFYASNEQRWRFFGAGKKIQ